MGHFFHPCINLNAHTQKMLILTRIHPEVYYWVLCGTLTESAWVKKTAQAILLVYRKGSFDLGIISEQVKLISNIANHSGVMII